MTLTPNSLLRRTNNLRFFECFVVGGAYTTREKSFSRCTVGIEILNHSDPTNEGEKNTRLPVSIFL